MPKRKQLGWLAMQKADSSGSEIISVYKHGSAVYLIRHYTDGPDERPVHPAAKDWIDEAATIWADLHVKGSTFQPFILGYPGVDTKSKS